MPFLNNEGAVVMSNVKSIVIWLLVGLAGAFSFATLALSRGEHVNAVWLVIAAVSCYSIAYRFYSLFIAKKVFELDDRRLTPAERHNDGLDYVPTNKWVLFGHHFAEDESIRTLAGRRSTR
jgi:carbon starvation protein